MNQQMLIEVVRLLRESANVTSYVKFIKTMMLSGSSRGFELDQFVTVVPLDDNSFDFEVAVDGRTILAHFERFNSSIGSQISAFGRYSFYLKNNDPTLDKAFVEKPIFQFVIEKTGTYSVGGEELRCHTTEQYYPQERNLILTHIVDALQRTLHLQQ